MDCSDGNVAVNVNASVTHYSGKDAIFACVIWLLRPTPAFASATSPASASAPAPGSTTLLGTVVILAATCPLSFPALKTSLYSFATRLFSSAVPGAVHCKLTAIC